jgi:hypothetical protein
MGRLQSISAAQGTLSETPCHNFIQRSSVAGVDVAFKPYRARAVIKPPPKRPSRKPTFTPYAPRSATALTFILMQLPHRLIGRVQAPGDDEEVGPQGASIEHHLSEKRQRKATMAQVRIPHA